MGHPFELSDHVDSAGTLMRENSMASKIMKTYSALIGRKFLKRTLGSEITEICRAPKENNISFEVDPEKIPSDEDLDENKTKLQVLDRAIRLNCADCLQQNFKEDIRFSG